MHGEAHTNIIYLAVERLIFLEKLNRLLRFLDNSIFNCQSEIFERILRLKSLTKSAQLEIDLSFCTFYLLLATFLINFGFPFALLQPIFIRIQIIVKLLTLLISEVAWFEFKIIQTLQHFFFVFWF